MSGLSRRTFIGCAAAGAVAVTAAAAVPSVAAAAPDDSPDHTGRELSEPVVARVRDLRTGEIVLYVGTEEIIHTDGTLALRLARAAAR
jgi:hypothetical protein